METPAQQQNRYKWKDTDHGRNTSANDTRNDYRSQATSTVLEGNNGLLIIGYNYSGNNLPALNTNVRSHAGSIQLRSRKGARIAGRLAG